MAEGRLLPPQGKILVEEKAGLHRPRRLGAVPLIFLHDWRPFRTSGQRDDRLFCRLPGGDGQCRLITLRPLYEVLKRANS